MRTTMTRTLFAALALGCLLFTSACQVTGTAPPSSADASPDGLNYIGEPGNASP